jgi:CubicO group peptidase (beta-lactamase class C family)
MPIEATIFIMLTVTKEEGSMRLHFHNVITAALFLVISIPFLLGFSATPEKLESLKPGKYDQVRQFMAPVIQKEMKKHKVPGLSIVLVDDQQVVWAQGFGYADEAKEVLATPETIYRVGSISKLFTATAVMQLVELGRIDIDKPLQAYLPEFSIKTRFPNSNPITLRSLMTHHSGLPANFHKGMWTKAPEPFATVVNRIRDEYAAFPPYFIFSYSNIGATLLGRVIEKTAGRDFDLYMDDSLLRPLGMTRSDFSDRLNMKKASAKGYWNGKETEEPALRDIPAGGLNSTVLDLARFIQMVFAQGRSGDRQILKPETLTEILRPQNAGVPLDLNFRVGLGWMLSSLGPMNIQNAGPVAHHGGTTLYFHSQLVILPEHKLGVVVLANSSTARSVVDKAAAETLALALEVKTGIKQPERKKPAEADGALSPEELLAYEGWYAMITGATKITKKSNYLRTEVTNRTVRLVPRVDGLLGLKYKLFGLIPIRLGELEYIGISRSTVAGREILKARSGSQELLLGEKIKTVPFPEKWLKRMGEYEIANRGDDAVIIDNVRLRYDDGFVLVEYSVPVFFGSTMSFALAPVSDTDAVIRGLGSGMGETIRVVTVDGGEMLYFSGYLLKKKAEK